MKIQLFIILIIAGILGVSGNAFALSQPNIECQQGNICVHPGDYITYSTEFNGLSTTDTYTFGNFIGTDKVNLSITSTVNGTKIQSNDILDLKTGFYNETANGGGSPILVLASTPITLDKTTIGVSEKTQSFNDIQRSIVSVSNNTQTATNEIAYDKETGVLMYLHLIPAKSTSALDFNFPTKYDLTNTNMFASSGTPADLQIPAWIKHNAKWWSQGQIDDTSFVQGVQYLIKQGVMKIPASQSDSTLSQKIPSWIKTNAGWWAEGQITDADFVKGIEYLANSGVIRV
jgi:hypothetical protein